MHNLLTLALCLLICGGCTTDQAPTLAAPDYPHEVHRIDYDRLFARDPAHNLTLVEGDVIWISQQPMFGIPSPLEVPTQELRAGNLWGTRPYTIKAGDVLLIEVYELRQPGVNDVQTVQVGERGMIRIASIGPMVAAGRTVKQFEADIATQLESDQGLHDPTIRIYTIAGQRQYKICGAPLAHYSNGPEPNSFSIPDDSLTLREALEQAQPAMNASTYLYVVRRPAPYSP